MDPIACLEAADQAISDEAYADAAQALADYFGWRDRGGYEPNRHEISRRLNVTIRSADMYAVRLLTRLADRLRQEEKPI